MKLGSRLQRLERRAPVDHSLIIIRHTLDDTGVPLSGRIVTHNGKPTADAIDARARLVAEGFDVAAGYGRAA
jgi:hypothetical protein